MSNNLPHTISGSTSSAPIPFTRAARLERSTRHTADGITASGYLDLIRTDIATAKGAAKVRGALAVESAGIAGLADFGDAVTSRLDGASGLAHKLVAEALTGTSRRIMNIVDAEIRNIAEQ